MKFAPHDQRCLDEGQKAIESMHKRRLVLENNNYYIVHGLSLQQGPSCQLNWPENKTMAYYGRAACILKD